MNRLYGVQHQIHRQRSGQAGEVQRVRALTGDLCHYIGFSHHCRVEHIPVIAQAADQRVIAGSPRQHVVARIAGQSIDQGIARQRVVAGSADHIFNDRCGIQFQRSIEMNRLRGVQHQIHRQRSGQAEEVQRVRAGIRHFYYCVCFGCRGHTKHIRVIAQFAEQEIIARSTRQRVVPRISRQHVAQRVARQDVIAGTAAHVLKRAGGAQNRLRFVACTT